MSRPKKQYYNSRNKKWVLMEQLPSGRMKIVKTSDSKFSGVPAKSSAGSKAGKAKAKKKKKKGSFAKNPFAVFGL